MEDSHRSEANSRSATQLPAFYGTQIFIIVFIITAAPSIHMLSHTMPVHILLTHFRKIYSYIILPSTNTSRSSKWSLRLRFSDYACYMPHPSNPPWFHRPSNFSCKVKITNRFIMLFSQGSRFCLLSSNISLSMISHIQPVYGPPLMWENNTCVLTRSALLTPF